MFWRFGRFCGGREPVNLLLPRNLDRKKDDTQAFIKD